MRVACALLFCEETDEMTYRANQITSLLVKPGWKAALQLPEVLYPVVADIRRFLSSTKFGRTGDELASSAFEFSHGKTIWKVLEEQPNQRRNFDMWLREKRMHEENRWYKRFPPCVSLSSANLKTDPDAVLMIDVGGGTGSQVIDFKAQFLHLPGRYVLQDLYALKINGATKHPDGVEVMAYDFFTPQPIKGKSFSISSDYLTSEFLLRRAAVQVPGSTTSATSSTTGRMKSVLRSCAIWSQQWIPSIPRC